MSELAVRAAIGVALGAAVAYAGLRARSLSASGAVAAAITGTVAVAAGWNWAAVLIAYFAVSSLLSRIGADRKRARVAGVVDKTGARDATQVMANGFPFVCFAAIALVDAGRPGVRWLACACGSLAASAADTWATEIGTWAGQAPRSVLTWRPLAVGESGGVTMAGWIASFAGAGFVAATAAVTGLPVAITPLIIIGGVAGAAADSIVGASIQRRSWCDACARVTEMRVHDCGAPTRHTGGLAWLENDGVNLIATVVGAVVTWIALLMFPGPFPIR